MPTDAPAGVRSIVITGASAGLGAALAVGYARPGRVLGLIARRAEPLEVVAEQCKALGATVVSAPLDVQDSAGLADWLARLDAIHPLEMVIANAGIFGGIGSDGLLESAEEVLQMLRTNLEGAILTASTAAELMRPRRQGRIALIASLAARQPLADAPVYSASKAGLAAYGEALRERLAPEGVEVSIVLPGHFDTAQTAVQRGAMPFAMSATQAAAIVRDRLERRRTTIAFPAPLVWLIRLGRCLPWRLRASAGRSLRFTVDDPR